MSFLDALVTGWQAGRRGQVEHEQMGMLNLWMGREPRTPYVYNRSLIAHFKNDARFIAAYRDSKVLQKAVDVYMMGKHPYGSQINAGTATFMTGLED